MHNLFVSIISLLLFFNTTVYSEIVKNIQITGNKRVSDETIKIYGEIKINEDYSESDLNKILSNLYSTNFFKDIKINLTNNTLQVNLKEYPTINQLIIVGVAKNKVVDEIKNIIFLR